MNTNAPVAYSTNPTTGEYGGSGSGSVTCTGKITAYFRWTGEEGTEPPYAIVRQSCVAIASKVNGVPSVDNGLSDPVVTTTVGPQKTSKAGLDSSGNRIDHYSIVADPSHILEVECTPSASGAAAGGASVWYTASASPLDVKLTGGRDGLQFLVGQKCTAQIESSLTTTSHQWSVIGGQPFKTFEVNHQPNVSSNGNRVALSSSDTVQEKLYVYFATDSETISITCSAHLSVPAGAKPSTGFDVNITRTTASFLPEVTESSVTAGSVVLTDPHLHAGARASLSGNSNLGIKWSSKVATPEDFVVGTDRGGWHWVQIITLSSTRTVPGVGTETQYCGSEGEGWWRTGLDTSYPYEPLPASGPNWYIADGGIGAAADTPSQTTESASSGYSLRDDFEVWQMYKPPGVDSVYVPLQKFQWHWGANLSWNGSQWTMLSTTHSKSDLSATATFPSWIRLVKAFWMAWR